jgi:hypothetical protein
MGDIWHVAPVSIMNGRGEMGREVEGKGKGEAEKA